jgi:hypothetical protein
MVNSGCAGINRLWGTYGQTNPKGRLSARLDSGRQIEFNASEHRHVDHGYAVTSHSSQGLTAERVLIHPDTGVHPDMLNSRFSYVFHQSSFVRWAGNWDVALTSANHLRRRNRDGEEDNYY